VLHTHDSHRQCLGPGVDEREKDAACFKTLLLRASVPPSSASWTSLVRPGKLHLIGPHLTCTNGWLKLTHRHIAVFIITLIEGLEMPYTMRRRGGLQVCVYVCAVAPTETGGCGSVTIAMKSIVPPAGDGR
jgi:hypothetical protein